MMRAKLQIFAILLSIVSSSVFADSWDSCMSNVIAHGGFAQKLQEIFKDEPKLSQELVDDFAPQLRQSLISNMIIACMKQPGDWKLLVEIARRFYKGMLTLKHNGEQITFKVDIQKLYQYLGTKTAIMISNNMTYNVGDPVPRTAIAKKKIF
ncbi:MAG: hypothetical protein LBD94_03315, partial [Rickettsiales bacterium]|nr:hypothetical protein [Rickettsiales bacterium]